MKKFADITDKITSSLEVELRCKEEYRKFISLFVNLFPYDVDVEITIEVLD